MISVEVRSSGPGPREVMRSMFDESAWWLVDVVLNDSRSMASMWTRRGLDHHGDMRTLCDGVAIIIRMEP